MLTQQGDVLLFQTDDDGDINVVNGAIEMSGGLETAVYLSLFGGNEDDDGRDGNPANWWGNYDEIDPAYRYRSEFQYLLDQLPPISANLRRLEEAGKRDLTWMVDKKVASSVALSVTIPSINRIKVGISVNIEGEESNFEFIENWKASL